VLIYKDKNHTARRVNKELAGVGKRDKPYNRANLERFMQAMGTLGLVNNYVEAAYTAAIQQGEWDALTDAIAAALNGFFDASEPTLKPGQGSQMVGKNTLDPYRVAASGLMSRWRIRL
jgi:hypothetical protein